MTPPKINSAIAVDDRTLEVEFAGGVKKRYSITPLLELEMFETLKNPALFKAVEAARLILVKMNYGKREKMFNPSEIRQIKKQNRSTLKHNTN